MLLSFLQDRCSMVGDLPQLKRNGFIESKSLFGRMEGVKDYMLRRVRMKKGVLHAISPDPNFDWSRIHHNNLVSMLEKKRLRSNNIRQGRTYNSPKNLPTTSKTFSNLGIEVQNDRRLCFGGQMLKGFLMPRRRSLQLLIMRGFLQWYSACIQLDNKSYDIDHKCFKEKENRFLKMFMKSRNVLWRLVMPSHRPHFYFH